MAEPETATALLKEPKKKGAINSEPCDPLISPAGCVGGDQVDNDAMMASIF